MDLTMVAAFTRHPQLKDIIAAELMAVTDPVGSDAERRLEAESLAGRLIDYPGAYQRALTMIWRSKTSEELDSRDLNFT